MKVLYKSLYLPPAISLPTLFERRTKADLKARKLILKSPQIIEGSGRGIFNLHPPAGQSSPCHNKHISLSLSHRLSVSLHPAAYLFPVARDLLCHNRTSIVLSKHFQDDNVQERAKINSSLQTQKVLTQVTAKYKCHFDG